MLIRFPSGFVSGNWLTDGYLPMNIISIIAAIAWFLWKAQCDAIFRNVPPNFPVMVSIAIAHVQEHINANRDLLGRRLILNNFSSADGLLLFSHASFSQNTQVRSIGFFLSNSNGIVFFSGCSSQPMDSTSSDDLFALEVALQVALETHHRVQHIFLDNHTACICINSPEPTTSWRYNHQLSKLRALLELHEGPRIHSIPRSWMSPASKLATLGYNYSNLNLFLVSRELPHWLMKSFVNSGFAF